MTPTISFTGKSGSGKTTLLEKLIPEMAARGRRVGVIKHTAHKVELDTEGKDTHRLRLAGASPAAIAAGGLLAVFQPLDAEPSLDEISGQYFTLPDIIFAEGFKRESGPQVLVLAPGAKGKPPQVSGTLIAIVADKPFKAGVPVFARNDVKPLADLIEKEFLKPVSRSEVRLWVDGKFVPLNPFVKAFVGQTVKGMVSSLKGAKRAEKIHIKIGR